MTASKLLPYLLVTALSFGQAALAELTIYPSAHDTKPLQPGTAMPAFSVTDVNGDSVVFDGQPSARPMVLITFRGGWCPYCNTQLQELRHVLPELSQKADVYFFSGDRPEALYAGLEDQTQEEIKGLGYTILSDADLHAASALGIAFKESAIKAGAMKLFLDLKQSSIAKHRALPVPAIFIVDTQGTIVYTYADPDYKNRLAPAELISALNSSTEPTS